MNAQKAMFQTDEAPFPKGWFCYIIHFVSSYHQRVCISVEKNPVIQPIQKEDGVYLNVKEPMLAKQNSSVKEKIKNIKYYFNLNT